MRSHLKQYAEHNLDYRSFGMKANEWKIKMSTTSALNGGINLHMNKYTRHMNGWPSVRRTSRLFTHSLCTYGRFNTFPINSRAISELLYQSVLYMFGYDTCTRLFERARQPIVLCSRLEWTACRGWAIFRAACVATNYEKFMIFFPVVRSSRQFEWIQRLNEMNVRSLCTFL